ncbi:hypothetical protein DY000_02041999 [Brassica cretica]|uniref:CCHC-type domain-containing protein n=1 Tax=Brassica cretica TaxID=69181 RepID=A0ABQ7B5Y7_BRACR|nr:hypothetical protein DY000_02041999 [Brassica cretica]
MHSGVCRAATGACHRCGSMDHKVRDCPEEDLRPKSQNKGVGERVCYNCGETGHYKNQCPNDTQPSGKRPSDGPQPAAKRQAIMPRVYTIGDESMDPSTSRPITDENAWIRVVSIFKKARSLRSDRVVCVLGRYVASELRGELGLYVATKPCTCSVAT